LLCIAGKAQFKPDSITLSTYMQDPGIRRLPALPANFYSTHTGFFCQKELQLEKKTTIPFRFRLGSIDYCDKLEGKRRALTSSNL